MTGKRGLLSWLVLVVGWIGLATPLWARETAVLLLAATTAERSHGAGQDGPAQAAPGQQNPGDPTDAEQITSSVEQRRHLSRRFAVGKAGRAFALDTRYGRVQLNAWNKSEIKVETELVARAETPAAAAQILDALKVQYLDYDASTGGISVSSQFGASLRGKCGGSRRYEVNYTIWLPRTTALRVAAAFADVILAGDWQGTTQLAVDYGTLRTARLTGARNTVRIANGDAIIPYVKQGSLHWLCGEAGASLDLVCPRRPTCILRHPCSLCSPAIVSSPHKALSRLDHPHSTSQLPFVPFLVFDSFIDIAIITHSAPAHNEILPCFHPCGDARRAGSGQQLVWERRCV